MTKAIARLSSGPSSCEVNSIGWRGPQEKGHIMTNADIIAKLKDVRLDAAALKAEIGRNDLMDSQIYYAGEIVRKIEGLLADLKTETL